MRKHKRLVTLSSIVSMVVLLGAIVGGGAPSVAMAVPATITYNLYATDGFISLADGTILYNYGFVGGRAGTTISYQNSMVAPPGAPKTFVPGALATAALPATPSGGPIVAGSVEAQLAGNAQFPAPLITAATTDVVQINLKNLGVTNKTSPNDPHSIHLHGMDVDAANDGVPETSVGAVPANMAVPGAGNIVVYMFSPPAAGTYFYHCHQEADIHVQMGMYGALIVYNPGEPGATSGPGLAGKLFGWNYDKDVVLLLTEVDVRQHVSEQQGKGGGAAFNPVNYQPQYWLINGLSFPNTIHAAAGPAAAFTWATWSAAHPGYDPLITGSVGATSTAGGTGQKVLIRMINMGFETQPMHMHGFHGKVIGSDQRAWTWAQPAPNNWTLNTGLEKNTITIGSGETYEWLINFGQQQLASTYQAGTQSRYTVANNLPVSNTLTANPAIPVPGIVPPVTYIDGPTVSGAVGIPMASQMFPFHNHDDYKATNNGVYPGGMFTIIVPTP
jgi:FtsP/CotA-like multicopper oxidase with cupredoxin domain